MKDSLLLVILFLSILGLSIVFTPIVKYLLAGICTPTQIVNGCITTEVNGIYSCNCYQKLKVANND